MKAIYYCIVVIVLGLWVFLGAGPCPLTGGGDSSSTSGSSDSNTSSSNDGSNTFYIPPTTQTDDDTSSTSFRSVEFIEGSYEVKQDGMNESTKAFKPSTCFDNYIVDDCVRYSGSSVNACCLQLDMSGSSDTWYQVNSQTQAIEVSNSSKYAVSPTVVTGFSYRPSTFYGLKLVADVDFLESDGSVNSDLVIEKTEMTNQFNSSVDQRPELYGLGIRQARLDTSTMTWDSGSISYKYTGGASCFTNNLDKTQYVAVSLGTSETDRFVTGLAMGGNFGCDIKLGVYYVRYNSNNRIDYKTSRENYEVQLNTLSCASNDPVFGVSQTYGSIDVGTIDLMYVYHKYLSYDSGLGETLTAKRGSNFSSTTDMQTVQADDGFVVIGVCVHQKPAPYNVTLITRRINPPSQ